MNANETREALMAECWTCGHVWPAVYLPMELTRAAIAMKRATCPMCGETGDNIHLAHESDAKESAK